MATQTDILRIRLEADGTGRVKASLADVGGGLQQIDTKAGAAKESALSLKSVLVGLASTAVVRGTIQTIVQFEKLGASLKTVTGSADAATAAFDGLKQFAATTPFQLQEVVDSFIKLKALGLDPSMDSLRSYGNTAAAMGKDLNQFIEAVADAATGEFERLKEFGIKAKSQGDEVSFTFQGVTTTVRKNAAEIEEYLQQMGNTQFATGMSDQMDTLGGAFSNLQDSTAQLAAALGDAGLSDLLSGLAGVFRDLATAMTATVDPSEQAARSASELSPAYKILAFTVFKLKQEFADLGDAIGATAAIAASIGPGFFDKLDAILEARRQKRQQLEQEAEDYVARLEGIGKPPSSTGGKKPPKSGGTQPAQPKGLVIRGSGKELEQYLNDLERRQEAFRVSMLTEQDLETERFEAQKRLQDELVEYGLQSEAERNANLEALREQHEQRMRELSEQGAIDWTNIWSSAGNRFAAGIGDAVAGAVLEQKNMADAMRSVLRGVLSQVISTLVEIGVKKTALAVLDKASIATTTAAVAASGTTIAASMAPAAAATSLATAGANAIPATAGITSTYALTSGLALAGIAHDGLDYVPSESTYLLDKGEMVLNKGNADAMRALLAGGGGQPPITVNMPINISAIDARGVDQLLVSRRGMIVSMAVRGMREAMESRGKRSPV